MTLGHFVDCGLIRYCNLLSSFKTSMQTQYASASPEAYETLRRDGVEAAWQFIQPVLDVWSAAVTERLMYAAGSWGPLEAALMIAADGRAWRNL